MAALRENTNDPDSIPSPPPRLSQLKKVVKSHQNIASSSENSVNTNSINNVKVEKNTRNSYQNTDTGS